ncbi:putative oxidoreductase [Patulibacter medicamentivorans]|uniref:Putative oxidoreductase n=1 Tax=Patulibacter medicamentivorans TaxID=1097667 RepID=H0E099_9ACTN|nr:NADP-dependent oxidoreductase [Patulibacter medicamentivorans]EHN12902.1 putative oxidoreductase [Patulibacter medicamentivorans]
MSESRNRQIVLAQLPGSGPLRLEHFVARDGARPVPGPRELLVRPIVLSIDSASRAWMNGPTYRPQLVPGDVMAGYALAEVVDAGDAAFAADDLVLADTGWQEWATVPATDATPVRRVAALTHHVSVLGVSGLTAHLGLHDVGRVRAGDTVVVSAAAGATGNVAGQLARIAGARVVGITGSPEKNAMLERDLGFDATVCHRDPDVLGALRAACPDGVDLYFDNVGGPLLDVVLRCTSRNARVVCCGAVSAYDDASAWSGLRQVPGRVVTHRLRIEGFIVLDLVDRWADATANLVRHVESGALRVLEDVLVGLDRAPEALIGMLAGENVGKRLVRVADDPG